ncbi:MAG TPA: hypothetical protein DCS93_03310 [Microscillaceae bacterium]|nr:hypothetical protein [Microscillaceae bacterium]
MKYLDSKPTGKVYDYFKNGILQTEIDSIISETPLKLHGKIIIFHQNKKKHRTQYYVSGKLKNEIYFNLDGSRALTSWQFLENKGQKLYRQGKYKEALNVFRLANEQAKKEFTEKNINYALSFHNLASLSRICGKYDNAERYFKEANFYYKKSVGVNHPFYASTLFGLATLNFEKGEYKKSEALNLKVLRLIRFKKIKYLNYKTVINSLATVYKVLGKYKKAETLYSEILQNINRNDTVSYLGYLYNLYQLYTLKGRNKKAELALSKSRYLHKIYYSENHPKYAAILNSTAVFYSDIGQVHKSESFFLRALKIRETVLGVEHPSYALTLNSLAKLYFTLGQHSKAKLYLERVANILKKKFGVEHPNYAIALNNLAQVAEKVGHNNEAKQKLLEAKKILRQYSGVTNSNYAIILNNLGIIYSNLLDYHKAKLLYEEALNIRKERLGVRHPLYATSLNTLSTFYFKQGKYIKAEKLQLEALSVRKKSLGETSLLYTESLYDIAIVYQTIKNYSESFKFYKEYFKIIDKVIINNFLNLNEEGKREFLFEKIIIGFELYNSFSYSLFTSSLTIPKSKKVLSQQYNNRLLTKSLLFNSTQKTKERIYTSKNDSVINLYEQFIAKRIFYNKMLQLPIAKRKKRGVNLEKLNEEIEDLEKALARKSKDFAKELEEYKEHTWKEVKHSLKKGEVAIELIRYRWYDKRWTDTVHYAALIVTPKSRYPYPVFLKNGNFLEGPGFAHYQKYTSGRNKIGKIDRESYTRFWQPIQQQIKQLYPEAKSVFVSLDGVYHQINLETLWNPATQQYLKDELDIRLVSNTKDLLQRSQRVASNAVNQTPIRVFGFPEYDKYSRNPRSGGATQVASSSDPFRRFSDLMNGQPIPKLAGTQREVSKILTLLADRQISARGFVGADATEENIKASRSPRVLHLATHGFFLENKDLNQAQNRGLMAFAGTEIKHYVENPLLRSGLLWTGAQATTQQKPRPENVAENGILTAQEALNLNLDHTDLVVLSACETGKGKIQNGEGVYGFQRAFLSAGAKSVLMSLWKVDDTANQWFMQYFYESWAKGQDVRKAYRYAQRKLRVDYPSPYYWGAFVLVGR